MANFLGAQQGLVSGFNIGAAAGGKLSGLGSVLKKVASRLTGERESKEALDQKLNLLGVEGLIKGQIEPTQEGGFKLPGTGRVKPVRETKSVIDSETGKILYEAPKKSVFKPIRGKTSIRKKEFKDDVSAAMRDLQAGTINTDTGKPYTSFEAFQLLSQKYPEDSSWLKRQLMEKSSAMEINFQDIISK